MIILYFYSSNYPYAIIDSNGGNEWYLNSSIMSSNISMIRSSIVIGSDRYNENSNVISLYQNEPIRLKAMNI